MSRLHKPEIWLSKSESIVLLLKEHDTLISTTACCASNSKTENLHHCGIKLVSPKLKHKDGASGEFDRFVLADKIVLTNLSRYHK